MWMSLDALLQAERDHVSRPFVKPSQAGVTRLAQRPGRAPIATPTSNDQVAETKLAFLAVCHGDMGWAAEGEDTDPQNQAQTKVFAWRTPRSVAAIPTVAGDRVAGALAESFGALRSNMDIKSVFDPVAETARDGLRQLVAAARDATDRGPKRQRVLLYYASLGKLQRPDQSALYFPAHTKRNATTQLPLADLLQYDGIAPHIMVLDCPSAGTVLQTRMKYDQRMRNHRGSNSQLPLELFLGCCGTNEAVPSHPLLPSDIFTSCLTTPLRMALLWFIVRHRTLYELPVSLVHAMRSVAKDGETTYDLRDTELAKALDAVLDSIAQTACGSDPAVYHKLYREDILVSRLFRNYLLAERIITQLGRTPCTYPVLEPTAEHPLWSTVDVMLDSVAAALSRSVHPLPSSGLLTSHVNRQRAMLDEVFARQKMDRLPPPLDATTLSLFEDTFSSVQTSLRTWGASNADTVAATQRLPIIFHGIVRLATRLKSLECVALYIDHAGVSGLLNCERLRMHGDLLNKLWPIADPVFRPAMLFIGAKSFYADARLIPRPVQPRVLSYAITAFTSETIVHDTVLCELGTTAGVRLTSAALLLGLTHSNLEYVTQCANASVPEVIRDLLVELSARLGGDAPQTASAEASMFTSFTKPPLAPGGVEASLLGNDPPVSTLHLPGVANGGTASQSDVLETLEQVLLALATTLVLPQGQAGQRCASVIAPAVLKSLSAASAHTRRTAVRCAMAMFAAFGSPDVVQSPQSAEEGFSMSTHADMLAESLVLHGRKEASPVVRLELCAALGVYCRLRAKMVFDATQAAMTSALMAATVGSVTTAGGANDMMSFGLSNRTQPPNFVTGRGPPPLPSALGGGGGAAGSAGYSFQTDASTWYSAPQLTGIGAGSSRVRPPGTPASTPSKAPMRPSGDDMLLPPLDLGASATPLALRCVEHLAALVVDTDPIVRIGAKRVRDMLRDAGALPHELLQQPRGAADDASVVTRPGFGDARRSPFPANMATLSDVAASGDDLSLMEFGVSMPAAVLGDPNSIEDVVLDALEFLGRQQITPRVMPSSSTYGPGWPLEALSSYSEGTSAYLDLGSGAGGGGHNGGGSGASYLDPVAANNREEALDAYSAQIAPSLCTIFQKLHNDERTLPTVHMKHHYEGLDARAFAFHPTLNYVVAALSDGQEDGAIAVLNTDGGRVHSRFRCATVEMEPMSDSNARGSTPSTPRGRGGVGSATSGVGQVNPGVPSRHTRASVTALTIIDPAVHPLLLTVSASGGVSIFGDFTTKHPYRVTAFSTLTPEFSSQCTSCLLAYEQPLHWAHVSGHRTAVSTWDLERQLAVDERDFAPTRDVAAVKALSGHPGNAHCYYVGYSGLGAAVMADLREPFKPAMKFSPMRSSCINIRPARHNPSWLTMVSALGVVRSWDLRRPDAPIFKDFVAEGFTGGAPVAPGSPSGPSGSVLAASASGAPPALSNTTMMSPFMVPAQPGGDSMASVPSTMLPLASLPALTCVDAHSCAAKRPLIVGGFEGRARLYGREGRSQRLPTRGTGQVFACLWHPHKLLCAVSVGSGTKACTSIYAEGAADIAHNLFDM